MADRHLSDPPFTAPPPAGEAADRFRQTFERAPVGIGHVTPDGRWLEFNQQLLDFLGYGAEELRGLHYRDFTHPEDVARYQAGRERLLAGDLARQYMEKRYVRKDGRVVWGALTMSVVRTRGDEPDYLIATVVDITERKQAEEAARAAEASYRSLAANVPGMVYQYVLRPDGTRDFTYVSESARTRFGVEPGSILADRMALFDLIHPEDRASFYATGAEAMTTLAPWRWEGRIVPAGGEERYVQLSSVHDLQPDGSVLAHGLLMDVTEQRATRDALRRSERWYRSLIENTGEPVGVLSADRRLVYASPAYLRVLGYAPEEVVGTPAFERIHPDDREAAKAAVARALETPGGKVVIRARYRHKDGSWRTLDMIGWNLLDDPAVRGIVVTGRDVTEQEVLEAQLRQSQKMEAVGRLAGGVAHDFNNLLTAILANTELMLSDLPAGQLREDAEAVRETAQRAAALTRQLLAFSRKQVAAPQQVELDATVGETMRLLRRTLGEEILIEADLAAPRATVLADPSQLEQVLLNLAVNARDAMPHGGVLTFRTWDGAPEESVVLSVEDTGSGIEREILPRIFEPFFTTKEQGKGTGLGLSTVYGIVTQMGGRIEVASTPGAGTAFTIHLPLHRGGADRGGPVPPRPAPSGTETVLLVEDEAAVRTSIRRILMRHGYQVFEARHGADALRIIEREGEAVQLVVTDLVMPEMGGRELIAALRARRGARPGAPRVLVMSGYDERAGTEGGAPLAGAGFIAKPFTVEGLLRAMRDVLDGAPDADS